MGCRSSSKPSHSGALALALLLLTGGCFADFAEGGVKLAGDGGLRRWVTIATCEAPDLQVALGFDLGLQYATRRQVARSVAQAQIWPEGQRVAASTRSR